MEHEVTAKILRIYIGQDDQWKDQPLYETIVMKLKVMEVAGAQQSTRAF